MPKQPSREAWCYETLRRLRWPEGIACPRCNSRSVAVHSRSSATPSRKYRCRGCRRMFTDLSGTSFARTNLPLETWFLYLRMLDQGYTTSELAKELGIKWDTVVALQRRIAMPLGQPGLVQQLRNLVQHKTRAMGAESGHA